MTQLVHNWRDTSQVGFLAEREMEHHWRTLGWAFTKMSRDYQLEFHLDYWLATPVGARSVDIKADMQLLNTGNYFLEIASNDGEATLGWLFTSHADLICFYTPHRTPCYVPTAALRERFWRWHFGREPRPSYNEHFTSWGLPIRQSMVESLALVEWPFNQPAITPQASWLAILETSLGGRDPGRPMWEAIRREKERVA